VLGQDLEGAFEILEKEQTTPQPPLNFTQRRQVLGAPFSSSAVVTVVAELQDSPWLSRGDVASRRQPVASADGSATAMVYDDGGQIYGQQACTGLLSTGKWSEVSPNGAIASAANELYGATTNGSSNPSSASSGSVPVATSSDPIQVQCPISSGQVQNNDTPTSCWWVVGPGTGAESTPPPNPQPGATYGVDQGDSCTWGDQGANANGDAEVYTCPQ